MRSDFSLKELLRGPTNRENRKVIGVKTMFLGYELQFLLSGVLPGSQNLNYKLQRKTVRCAAYLTKSSKIIPKVF